MEALKQAALTPERRRSPALFGKRPEQAPGTLQSCFQDQTVATAIFTPVALIVLAGQNPGASTLRISTIGPTRPTRRAIAPDAPPGRIKGSEVLALEHVDWTVASRQNGERHRITAEPAGGNSDVIPSPTSFSGIRRHPLRCSLASDRQQNRPR